MLELLTPIMSALSVSVPILCSIWIWRNTKKIRSPNGLFAIVIIAFSAFHFSFSGHHILTLHELTCSIFYILTACMNVFCSTYTNVNVGINRRKEQRTEYGSQEDRRVKKAHTIVKK